MRGRLPAAYARRRTSRRLQSWGPQLVPQLVPQLAIQAKEEDYARPLIQLQLDEIQ